MQTESVNNSVVVDTKVAGYKMRFDDVITAPNYYRFELEALAVAEQDTPVEITVNSDGGSLATGIEMANAIVHCNAPVKGVLRSSCHSCGSIIFLACDSHEVGLASEMLLHSGSGGVGGTPSQAIERAKSYKRQVRTLFETVYKGFLNDEELDLLIEKDKEFIFCEKEIVERLEKMYSYREDKNNSAMEEILQHQNSEMEKYENILLDKLVEEGSITEKDKQIALKVQKASEILDKTLSDEDVNNLMNDTFLDESIEEDLPSFMIFDTNDQEYAIVSYEILDGEPIRVELELLEEEGTILVNKPFLQDIPKEELKSILDNLGVKYAWNAGDVRLAEMVEQAITETAKEHLEENLK